MAAPQRQRPRPWCLRHLRKHVVCILPHYLAWFHPHLPDILEKKTSHCSSPIRKAGTLALWNVSHPQPSVSQPPVHRQAPGQGRFLLVCTIFPPPSFFPPKPYKLKHIRASTNRAGFLTGTPTGLGHVCGIVALVLSPKPVSSFSMSRSLWKSSISLS